MSFSAWDSSGRNIPAAVDAPDEVQIGRGTGMTWTELNQRLTAFLHARETAPPDRKPRGRPMDFGPKIERSHRGETTNDMWEAL